MASRRLPAHRPGELTPEKIACARLLHIDGHDTAAVARAAEIARAHRIPVTVDVDTIYPGFERVLPNVDYLVASSEFPSRWTGEPDPFRALAMIQDEYGMRVAAMTLGADGALARVDGRFLYSPGFVVNCVDTTGAGDVFHGAFCYAVFESMPMREALEFSNAMAALNCTALGARGRIASFERRGAVARAPHGVPIADFEDARRLTSGSARVHDSPSILRAALYARQRHAVRSSLVNVLVFLYELSLGMSSYRAATASSLHYGIVPDRLHYLLHHSPRCSSMADSCTSRATCGSCGFSAAAWRICSGTRNICFCTSPAELRRAVLFVLVNSNSTVPTIGASGAIAGIMGAYLIKFPRAHIVTLVFIFVFITTVDIPAAFLLLYWFAIQFFSGVGSVGYSQISNGDVAWFAHVGGFLAGMGLVMLMPTRARVRPWYRDV